MTNTIVTTPVNVTGAPVTNTVANHAEKPEKFNGQNFKRWQQKMFFYLGTLNLAWFLNEIAPQVKPSKEGSLYNVYCKTTTAKELWESLERKHKTEDAIAAIIEKLPPSWVEFKNYLKHTRKKMSVEDLVVRLRIEEDNKLAQKNTYTPDSAKDNMVEHIGSSSKSNSKAKGKGKGKGKDDKKGKGKAECLAPKANMDMIAMVSDVIAMISEVNLVGSNNSGWWVDIGATHHVCANKSMFHSFRAFNNGETLYMGNSATTDNKGEGDVILKMISEKELKLTNVLYVLEIRKNLMSVVVMNDINKINSSAYLIDSSHMWHGRLGHKTEVENQLGRKIKVVRSDRGDEYVSLFAEICVKHGIRHEFTAPYSPQQNSITERKNRTLKEMVNAMLISSGLSHDMWGEAILTATYLLNKIPRKEKEETPYKLRMGRKPSYQYLRVWGV
ncbi:retrovirus-related pol polyprotein from transposon TNT 1-94, partial [Tanacetum coccineum]